MSRLERMEDGNDDDMFVMTRDQIRFLMKNSYAWGKTGGFYPKSFECVGSYEDCVHSDDERCDTCAKEYQRLRRLHDVTAGHLTKARAELVDLRLDNECAHAELRLWRGSEPSDRHVPSHYAGDGLVTCSRAMESASAQGAVVPQSAMQRWWWMCAFKYVWRMWSKGDPAADAGKAVDCLEHVKDSLEEDLDER